MTIVRMTTTALFRGQVNQNVFHMLNTDGFLSLADCCTEIRDNWLLKIRGMQTGDYLYTNVEAREVDPAGAAPVNLALALTGTITSTNVADMNYSAIVLKFQTATAGRHGRGRYFVGGVSFGSINAGIVTPTGLGLPVLQPLVDALNTRYSTLASTGPLTLVVAPRASPGDAIVVTNISIRSIAGVQRRRQWGVGI